jgi:hypothetical protein
MQHGKTTKILTETMFFIFCKKSETTLGRDPRRRIFLEFSWNFLGIFLEFSWNFLGIFLEYNLEKGVK